MKVTDIPSIEEEWQLRCHTLVLSPRLLSHLLYSKYLLFSILNGVCSIIYEAAVPTVFCIKSGLSTVK